MITDPLRSSSTPIPRGFALKENLSTELLAQGPLQAEVPAPEHQVVPQVTVPNNTDASDRSRASSIHVPPDEGDGNIIMPIPVNVGHPRSIQEAASARNIRGFDTGETPPPLPRSGSPENVSPSGGIHMDLGVLPSRLLYPPGQGRRRVPASSQEPERGEIGSGDGRAQVGWVVPFSADSRQSNAYKQDFRESPDATRNFETREASPTYLPQARARARLAMIYIYNHLPTLTMPPSHPRGLHPHRRIDHSMPTDGPSTFSRMRASIMYTKAIKSLPIWT
ncbi:hypothetical protein BD779DRAFT_351545 [Infundibulicybe gibba]|nr:hypothetical protein BD779DRAFT_351545 [Infundibulicybe gibba]